MKRLRNQTLDVLMFTDDGECHDIVTVDVRHDPEATVIESLGYGIYDVTFHGRATHWGDDLPVEATIRSHNPRLVYVEDVEQWIIGWGD